MIVSRTMVCLALALCCWAAPQLPAQANEVADARTLQQQIEAVVQRVEPATVAVIKSGQLLNQGSASGVIVSSDGLVLTAAHCICCSDEGQRYDVVLHLPYLL